MEFLVNTYIVKKFGTDTFIEGLTIERERTIMSVMNSQAVREYQKQYIKSISGGNDHFKQLNIFILVGFGFLLLLIYLIILRCEYKTRLN